MTNFKIIAFFLLFLSFTAKVYSQGNLSVHLGPAFPVMDFGSDDVDNEDAGGAGVGFNIGLRYVYPLSESGFGLFGGIDFCYNALKKGVKEDIEDLYESLGLVDANIKHYKYINVPLSAGLNYTYYADQKIGVFANAGLALNFLKVTDMEISKNGQKATTQMDLASNLGFKIGGGILINKKTSISIDYLGLGKHDIEGEVKTPLETEEIDGEGKVDLVTLTLGIKF